MIFGDDININSIKSVNGSYERLILLASPKSTISVGIAEKRRGKQNP